jgi:uncharacterized protein YdaU (DUF1376 family)
MADFPALPLFTDAYLADAGHLSEVEHGRYLLMLMLMWRSPGCRFPNDDNWLAHRFRKTVEQVKAELRPLIAEFMQCDGNWITQKRLLKEWKWCHEKKSAASVSAKSRWDKKKSVCVGNAPYPTLLKKVEEVKKETSSTGAVGKKVATSEEEFEQFWQAYPHREGANPKAPARKAWATAVKTETNPQTIIAAAKAYATDPSTKVGTPYVAQAVTWLHQQRWQDYAEKAAEYARLEAQRAAHEAEQERAKIYWLNQINAKQDAAS